MPTCDLSLLAATMALLSWTCCRACLRGFSVIVSDNGSTDDTAAVARRLGATVVTEPSPSYGAAVHAGLLAATSDYVAFMDGDGSFVPADPMPMLADVHEGRTDLAVGRRRPVSSSVWPWHERAGNAAIVAWLRHRIGMTSHDIAPIRVCRRDQLLVLDVQDRRSGYPVELLQKATLAGRRRLVERDVAYYPNAGGTRSKVSGSVVGTVRAARDFAGVPR